MEKWEWIARHDIDPERIVELERKWENKLAAEEEQAERERQQLLRGFPDDH